MPQAETVRAIGEEEEAIGDTKAQRQKKLRKPQEKQREGEPLCLSRDRETIFTQKKKLRRSLGSIERCRLSIHTHVLTSPKSTCYSTWPSA